MTSAAPDDRTDRRTFRQRLGYLLLGLAIGCVMLGIVHSGRRAHFERERQAAQQRVPITDPSQIPPPPGHSSAATATPTTPTTPPTAPTTPTPPPGP